MRQVIKTVFVIIAVFIGAGFASGQEINVFFYSYGVNGILGIITCSLLTTYIIYKVLMLVKNNKIENYKDFALFLIDKQKKEKTNTKKNGNNLALIINIIINLFLLLSFIIMAAGFGAFFSQEIHLHSFIGRAVLALLCFVTFIGHSNRVIKINSFLIPILIVAIVIIGIINISSIDMGTSISKIERANKNGWLLSSILYSSYNSISLIPVIITLKKYVKNKSDILAISWLSGAIVFVLAMTIFWLLVRANIDVNKLEMPVIFVIRRFFVGFKNIYAFIILASIYTTAISIGISILQNFSSNKTLYWLSAFTMCVIGFLASSMGFSNLISYIYPIFGYLGLIQIIAFLA